MRYYVLDGLVFSKKVKETWNFWEKLSLILLVVVSSRSGTFRNILNKFISSFFLGNLLFYYKRHSTSGNFL